MTVKDLFCALVLYRHNFSVLHWKTKGALFDNTHARMDEYGKVLSGYIDDIAEIMLMCNENPPCLHTCMEYINNSEHKFLCVEGNIEADASKVDELTKKMFDDLMYIYTEVETNCGLPDDTVSDLHTHHSYIRKENTYKLKRRMIYG